MKQIAAGGNNEISSVRNTLYPLAVASETKEGIRRYAMRQAFWSLDFCQKKHSNLYWHLNSLLWYQASLIHLNNQEIFGIWVNCSLNCCGDGLRKAAKRYYGKTISNLTQKELAGLVVLVRSPYLYKPGTEKSEEQIKIIMKKVNGS